ERAADWDEVRASAANLSLFAARRVMEIRLASGRPGTAGNAALIALLEARDPDTLFLILTPRLDRDAQGADWVRSVEAYAASQQRHRAALEQALRRASRLPFAALARRAARVDRTIKGRVVGDAWDQLALLAADICGQPPASGLRRARAM